MVKKSETTKSRLIIEQTILYKKLKTLTRNELLLFYKMFHNLEFLELDSADNVRAKFISMAYEGGNKMLLNHLKVPDIAAQHKQVLVKLSRSELKLMFKLFEKLEDNSVWARNMGNYDDREKFLRTLTYYMMRLLIMGYEKEQKEMKSLAIQIK